MTRIGMVALSVVMVVAAVACLYALRQDGTVVQPKIFVSSITRGESNGGFLFAPDTCPNAAFVVEDKEAADYLLTLVWDSTAWTVIAERKDGALLISPHDSAYRSADFEVLLRRACRVVMRDTQLWARDQLHSKIPENAAQQVPDENRFQLGDARNGPKITTAIIDKKTGRVWLWTQVHDNNGKETGSEFREEDVTPKPDAQ